MSDFPNFTDFYVSVNGREPFPWQMRLAELVAGTGWPADIGVPTGLGKTSTIDVAVWALAAQAAVNNVQLPRRIWYVVDRRLLVDAASDHAQNLADQLADPQAPHAVRAVGAALSSLAAGGDRPPLAVSRLRGGGSSNPTSVRPPDPAQPAIICATVAMYGSRLLFRGYGSSRSMWPIDAALAGIDSLVLLDEAHLARPLQKLVHEIAQCDANTTGVMRPFGRFHPTAGTAALLPAARSRPVLVNLTATGSKTAFDLNHADHDNPVIHKRMSAQKPSRLLEVKRGKLPATLARETLSEVAQRPGCAAVVFVNSPRTAREVAEAMRKEARDLRPLLLTGQLRDPDAHSVRETLLNPSKGCPAGTLPNRQTPLIVIATQTLEVGADLDFDVCVSQSAGARAIVQRWGRLNRLGTKPNAIGIIVHEEGSDGGIYGQEAEKVFQRLSLAHQPVNLSPGVIAKLVGAPEDDCAQSGEILPAHLWEFAKTSVPPPGAAPPELFFDALEAADRRVSIMWRAVVPLPGEEIVPSPRQGELVDVPIGEVRDFLKLNSPGTRHDGQTSEVAVISEDGNMIDFVDVSGIRPGMTIVLPTNSGGYGSSGWDPSSTADVTDLSPQLGHTLHLTSIAVENAFGPVSLAQAVLHEARSLEFSSDEGPDILVDREIARRLGQILIRECAWLSSCSDFAIMRCGPDQEPVLQWEPVVCTPPLLVDALDELSNAPRVGLQAHLEAVAELADLTAKSLGLPKDLCQAVEWAGRFHDLGKADDRFQAWLGGSPGEQLAKSVSAPGKWQAAALAAGWTIGARHELLSLQIIDQFEAMGGEIPEPSLVRHLVLSHHGHGRPSCPTRGGGIARTRVRIGRFDVLAETDPSVEDWAQPRRFRELTERFGYWGLALMEAIVRQSDHRVSAATEVL